MKYIAIAILWPLLPAMSAAPEPGWPREMSGPEGKLIYYQPQIDTWKDYRVLARMGVSLTPARGQTAVGVVHLSAQTNIDLETYSVTLRGLAVIQTNFPSPDPSVGRALDRLVRTFLSPPASAIALGRVVVGQEKPPIVAVRNDAPPIFISFSPALLLFIEREPVRTPISGTRLDFVVNANWPLFFDTQTFRYYLLSGSQWLSTNDLAGSWTRNDKLPKDFSKIPSGANWADVKENIPPQAGDLRPVPRVFYSGEPAEILVFNGQPDYSKIPGTRLAYATNTDSDVFFFQPAGQYYCLIAGRWFRAANPRGPWSFVAGDLPVDFSRIPANSPAARVLISVPGTPEAADAVMLAQIPVTVTVDPSEAESKVKTAYYGKPDFEPISGTQLSYAANTQDKIVMAGDLYYLCFQAIWFVSSHPDGPWKTAGSVPREIYTIPPSSPVYNVTYVTQRTINGGQVQSNYTAGYMGVFVMASTPGATLAYGSGYYYAPYIDQVASPYAIYHPYPCTYGAAGASNPYTGRNSAGSAAYGPYGGAGWGVSYDAGTGTYFRIAGVHGPFGNPTVAQAYNPYTGASATTRQGSAPYAQWGSSVVVKGY